MGNLFSITSNSYISYNVIEPYVLGLDTIMYITYPYIGHWFDFQFFAVLGFVLDVFKAIQKYFTFYQPIF